MKLNKKYIFITLTLFIIEVLIAFFLRDRFIRPFFGDLLVVMLLFSFFRIFNKGNNMKIGISVLLFAYLIEILQYFQLVKLLGLQDNKIAMIVLGATFDWLDLAAYTFGIILSIILDKKFNNLLNQQ